MVGYLIRRLIQTIIVTLIVTIITFFLLHLVPGGEVRAVLGVRASPAEIAADSKAWGFDQPIYIQYLKWLWQVMHGNFGFDILRSTPVSSLIWTALPRTIVLAVIGTGVGLLIGIPLGIFQAVRRYTAIDHIVTGVGFVGYGSPTFFIGLLLVQWFAIDLHIFPAFAPQATSLVGILSDPVALVLPVATYAFVAFALWSRFMRSSVLDNIVQDYVRTARAKGASERRVLWGHIFRNSLITIVTLLGLQLPVVIGGAIFIEYVFNYPGMGLLFFQAAEATDIQLMLAITVITTVVTILGNLLADIGYAMLDPRVRYS
ncbi:MAG TPA: ABC transporter permease [Streptosporangiaceae bacterium]|nr:ABC transporter permease [Streptosporangiaceae bacterium]